MTLLKTFLDKGCSMAIDNTSPDLEDILISHTTDLYGKICLQLKKIKKSELVALTRGGGE
jgi:hypothetical protein